MLLTKDALIKGLTEEYLKIKELYEKENTVKNEYLKNIEKLKNYKKGRNTHELKHEKYLEYKKIKTYTTLGKIGFAAYAISIVLGCLLLGLGGNLPFLQSPTTVKFTGLMAGFFKASAVITAVSIVYSAVAFSSAGKYENKFLNKKELKKTLKQIKTSEKNIKKIKANLQKLKIDENEVEKDVLKNIIGDKEEKIIKEIIGDYSLAQKVVEVKKKKKQEKIQNNIIINNMLKFIEKERLKKKEESNMLKKQLAKSKEKLKTEKDLKAKEKLKLSVENIESSLRKKQK